MGSFIVTVVGDNPEQQMLKYSSASSPELPNPYMLMHDITEKLKSEIPSDFLGCQIIFERNVNIFVLMS